MHVPLWSNQVVAQVVSELSCQLHSAAARDDVTAKREESHQQLDESRSSSLEYGEPPYSARPRDCPVVGKSEPEGQRETSYQNQVGSANCSVEMTVPDPG